MKIPSKCSLYRYGEKSPKNFYRPEKKKSNCGTIKTLINDGKEITIPNEINLTLKRFYENLFKKDIKKCLSDIENFLSQIQLPAIRGENHAKCETSYRS